MVVTETTNAVFNTSLFVNVTEQTVPYWIRITVANRMASNGQEWAYYFGLYNSGTYVKLLLDLLIFLATTTNGSL